ncbi:MAG: hypothetical protein EOO96_11805 [Pedobacter sp.]|nr:hypothetical protein ASG14_01950 [Pedobacter sp. Leaf194]RZL33654.1 MAG: hypothetical protein EOO96_11805 [Pedobacter sp.]
MKLQFYFHYKALFLIWLSRVLGLRGNSNLLVKAGQFPAILSLYFMPIITVRISLGHLATTSWIEQIGFVVKNETITTLSSY